MTDTVPALMWRLYQTFSDDPEQNRLYYSARYRPDGTIVLHRDGSGINWRWSGDATDAYPLEEKEARRLLSRRACKDEDRARFDQKSYRYEAGGKVWYGSPAKAVFEIEEIP